MDIENLVELQAGYKECTLHEALAFGNFMRATTLADSGEVAGVIVRLSHLMTDDRAHLAQIFSIRNRSRADTSCRGTPAMKHIHDHINNTVAAAVPTAVPSLTGIFVFVGIGLAFIIVAILWERLINLKIFDGLLQAQARRRAALDKLTYDHETARREAEGTASNGVVHLSRYVAWLLNGAAGKMCADFYLAFVLAFRFDRSSRAVRSFFEQPTIYNALSSHALK